MAILEYVHIVNHLITLPKYAKSRLHLIAVIPFQCMWTLDIETGQQAFGKY